MTRSILIGAAVIAAAALPQAPVMAQASDGIVVTAPVVRDNSGQPRNAANPRKLLTASAIVYTGDLDLRTEYGRDVLDNRVRVAADNACDRLDAIESTGIGAAMNPDAGDCRQLAMRNARPAVRTAILLDRG
jgi:UrcA family protein